MYSTKRCDVLSIVTRCNAYVSCAFTGQQPSLQDVVQYGGPSSTRLYLQQVVRSKGNVVAAGCTAWRIASHMQCDVVVDAVLDTIGAKYERAVLRNDIGFYDVSRDTRYAEYVIQTLIRRGYHNRCPDAMLGQIESAVYRHGVRPRNLFTTGILTALVEGRMMHILQFLNRESQGGLWPRKCRSNDAKLDGVRRVIARREREDRIKCDKATNKRK